MLKVFTDVKSVMHVKFGNLRMVLGQEGPSLHVTEQIFCG